MIIQLTYFEKASQFDFLQPMHISIVGGLLKNLPSVDQKGGKISAQRVCLNLVLAAAGNPLQGCTMTEMVCLDSLFQDGLCLLNIQIPCISLDTTASKPVLYKMTLV